MTIGESCEIRGVSGEGFVGTLASTTGSESKRCRASGSAGQAWYSGRGEMIAESGILSLQASLPRRLADLDAPA